KPSWSRSRAPGTAATANASARARKRPPVPQGKPRMAQRLEANLREKFVPAEAARDEAAGED
ncbi:hypothetical protein CATMIT_01741, partial [Catenibacterium mitsuokai DSM 15897]